MLLKTLNRLVSRITFIAKRKNRSLFPQPRNIALVLSSITLSFSLAAHAENQPSNDSGLSETGFKSYVAQLKKEAAEKGIDKTKLDLAFADITFRPTVVKSDKSQPEKKNNVR